MLLCCSARSYIATPRPSSRPSGGGGDGATRSCSLGGRSVASSPSPPSCLLPCSGRPPATRSSASGGVALAYSARRRSWRGGAAGGDATLLVRFRHPLVGRVDGAALPPGRRAAHVAGRRYPTVSAPPGWARQRRYPTPWAAGCPRRRRGREDQPAPPSILPSPPCSRSSSFPSFVLDLHAKCFLYIVYT